jgi:D-alanyl-D-alanine carboxypeptidase
MSEPQVHSALDGIVAAGAPGAAATWTDGRTTYFYAAGVRDLRTHQPIRRTDYYRIASQTKPFTAVIVLELAGEGRLRLSDTVQHWLPGMVPGGRRITIRQLLNMTSGLPDYVDVNRPLVYSVLSYPELRWRPEQLVAIGAAHGPAFGRAVSLTTRTPTTSCWA